MQRRISKHFEHRIWDNAVSIAIENAFNSLDVNFKEKVNLSRKEVEKYKKTLSDIYEEKREWLKKIYFGFNADDKKKLDMHKIAAVVCRSILKCKPFEFDTEAADRYKKKNKKNDDTKWIVDNYLINYKVALNSALLLTLYDTVDRLDREKDDRSKIINKLSNSGFSYYIQEPKLLAIEHETFYRSLVLNLAINDLNKRSFDYLSFAAIMFQLQQYEVLRAYCLQENKQ